jgi:hypothetical protein
MLQFAFSQTFRKKLLLFLQMYDVDSVSGKQEQHSFRMAQMEKDLLLL